jgi:hypothetical protein
VYLFNKANRDSSVAIATGWQAGVLILAAVGFFSSQLGCGAHPASYPIGTERFPRRVEWPGREAEYSHPSSVEVKNGGAIPPLPRVFTGTTLPFLPCLIGLIDSELSDSIHL